MSTETTEKPLNTEFLTGPELGKILRFEPGTIRRWHREGVIPSTIFEGASVRYKLEDVKKALAARAKKHQAARKRGVFVEK